MKCITFSKRYTCNFSLFFPLFYGFMLVYCVYFRYFPSTIFCARKRDKNSKEWRRRTNIALMVLTVAFTSALAMMWQKKATSIERNVKKAYCRTHGILHEGHRVLHGPLRHVLPLCTHGVRHRL